MQPAETVEAAWVGNIEDRLATLERECDELKRENKRLKTELQELAGLRLLSGSGFLTFSDNAEVRWYLNDEDGYDHLKIFRCLPPLLIGRPLLIDRQGRLRYGPTAVQAGAGADGGRRASDGACTQKSGGEQVRV